LTVTIASVVSARSSHGQVIFQTLTLTISGGDLDMASPTSWLKSTGSPQSVRTGGEIFSRGTNRIIRVQVSRQLVHVSHVQVWCRESSSLCSGQVNSSELVSGSEKKYMGNISQEDSRQNGRRQGVLKDVTSLIHFITPIKDTL
jgi:hypothetical protein